MAASLVLGTIMFTDWEIPDQISFGGKHATARHGMIGGKAVIDAMGPVDTEIEWKGTFVGPMAQLRARRVDLLRRSGRKVVLTWSSFIYEVIVVGFRGDFQRSTEIPYFIECMVVRDVVSDALGPLVQRLEDGLRDSLTNALGAAGGDPVLVGAVTGVQATMLQVVTGGTPTIASLGVAARGGLQATAANAFAVSTASAVSADTAMASSSEGFAAGKDPAALSASLDSTSAAAQGASHARATSGYLGVTQAQIAPPLPLPPPPAPPLPRGLPIPLPPPPAPPLP